MAPDSEFEFYRILEEGTINEPKFFIEGKTIPVPPLAEQVYNLYWDYPIALFSTDFSTTDDNINDSLNVDLAPDTCVGRIDGSLNVGDTQMFVTSPATDHLKVGFTLKIVNADTMEMSELGKVIKIDRSTGLVEFNSPSTINVASDQDSRVLMTINAMQDYRIAKATEIKVGRPNTTGLYVPARTRAMMKYTNSTSTSKIIQMYFTYVY